MYVLSNINDFQFTYASQKQTLISIHQYKPSLPTPPPPKKKSCGNFLTIAVIIYFSITSWGSRQVLRLVSSLHCGQCKPESSRILLSRHHPAADPAQFQHLTERKRMNLRLGSYSSLRETVRLRRKKASIPYLDNLRRGMQSQAVRWNLVGWLVG